MTPRELAILGTGATGLGVSLDEEAVDRLDRFLALLVAWNRRLRLTGERSPDAIVRHHIVDSLAAIRLLPDVGPIVDLGTGAGFPGIVLGCVRPRLPIVLVDARRRPISFLREVIRALGLEQARAVQSRAEDLARTSELAGAARLVVSRAVRLDEFLRLARPLLAPDGLAVAMQTPRTATRLDDVARRHGLRVASVHPYELAGGRQRTLVSFATATS